MAPDRGSDQDSELLPADMSARTTVHEYGGRAWAIAGPASQLIVTSNFIDQRLWVVQSGAEPRALTAAPQQPKSVRFACPVASPDGQWVVAVRERHMSAGVVNDLVAVPLGPAGGEPRVLAEGHDFYSSPVFSPGGDKLAFVCWDHPCMPWDRTELWCGSFVGGSLAGLLPGPKRCR